LLITCGFIAVAATVAAGAAWQAAPAARPSDQVTILGPSAVSLDPAVQWDAGSAQVVAQVFESLTAVDAAGQVQPALAASWETLDSGHKVVFHLRPGLRYSDGSPIRAADVVASWMRVINPAHPSQLSSLLDDVVGAEAYAEGTGSKGAVGLRATGDGDVEVDLANPASDFPAIASCPVLAVVPPDLDSNPRLLEPGAFVGSGAYTISALTETETTLVANPNYWAGTPAIKTVHLLSSTGGRNEVDMFSRGQLDYTPVDAIDALWLAYDKNLGPSLRLEPSPTVEYYGFDTSRPPFDDVHVRRAFAMGVNWRRIVTLMRLPTVTPATGMVPPGVPGHSGIDFGPRFDVAAARAELAAAGYPGAAGLPTISLVTGGSPLDRAVVAELKANLGIDVYYQSLDFETYNERLVSDPPEFWEMNWAADYPGANDFLGLLLGSGKPNNFGRWRSVDFDAAIARALAAPDQTSMQQALGDAQAIVKDQVPVIPVDFGAGYALAAKGLLGAAPNAQGLVRYAGLAWADR
jgi:ABC-type transport system substrate-binding protein